MPRNFRGSVKGPIWLGLSMFLDRKHGFDRKKNEWLLANGVIYKLFLH
jgi:hypothetical protein